MKWHAICLVASILGAPVSAQGPQATKITWKKTVVDKVFRSEGVAVADVNKDGKPDIIVGDVWYEAPDWKMHPLRKEKFKSHDPAQYSEAFAVFADDFNGDGYPDVIVIPFPGKECYWYENPKGKDELWKEHLLTNSACNETPIFVDLFKTGKKVLVMGWQPPQGKGFGEVCYFQPGKDPTQAVGAHFHQRQHGQERPRLGTVLSRPGRRRRQRRWPGRHHHAAWLVGAARKARWPAVEMASDQDRRELCRHARAGQEQRRPGRHRHKLGPRLRPVAARAKAGQNGNVFLTKDLFPTPPALAKEPAGFKFNKEEQALFAAVNKLRDTQKHAPWRANAKLCDRARDISVGAKERAEKGVTLHFVAKRFHTYFAPKASRPC